MKTTNDTNTNELWIFSSNDILTYKKYKKTTRNINVTTILRPPLKNFLQKHYLKETNYLTENIPNVTTSTTNVNQSQKHTSSKK